MTDTANFVKEKRIRMGLTQLELAILLGLKENGERTVRGWELAEHKPSKTAISKLLSLSEHTPFKNKNIKPLFTFIDLFAGIGGIRLPFQELGEVNVYLVLNGINLLKLPMLQIMEMFPKGI